MRFSTLLAQAHLGGPGGAGVSTGSRRDGPRRRPAFELTGDAEVKRVVTDSRQAQGGDCFVAVRGTASDGHKYIAQAVAAGCSAVVCEDAAGVPPAVACAVVGDTRVASAHLAQAIRGWPARKLTAIGVTGTNGKTTFTYLVRRLLERQGHTVGLIGTIAYQTPGSTVEATNTTPGALELAEMMDRLVAAGGRYVVMEVSSHALEQRRVAGIDFAVGVFTNLTGDHLDYHQTMDNYLSAKRRLFESLSPEAFAVLNRDDPASEGLAKATSGRVVFYGLSPAADVQAKIQTIDASGTGFLLCHAGRQIPVRTPLLGRHNVSNCLAAAAAGLALGVSAEAIAAALGEVSCVPGRLQAVPSRAPFAVLVDYAHTDDALLNVLSALRPLTGGRLILVFGCGGDRDRTKRPRMAAVAEKWADAVIVTSDNPRAEVPSAIIEEIVAGFSDGGRGKALVQEDRRQAIGQAIASAQAGDIVLIAGKGHENYQILGDRKIHFDDVETAGEFLRQRGL